MNVGLAIDIGRQRSCGPMVAPELGESPEQLLRPDRVPSRHECDGIARRPRFIEAPPPPTLEDGVKREIRVDGIKDIGAWVNASLHGVASQEIMAKAVNRGAGQSIKTKPCVLQGLTLGH